MYNLLFFFFFVSIIFIIILFFFFFFFKDPAATEIYTTYDTLSLHDALPSSACGVCGAVLIEDLRRDLAQLPAGPTIDPALLPPLVERLRSGQGVFERTGGLHAAGLFSSGGDLICM